MASYQDDHRTGDIEAHLSQLRIEPSPRHGEHRPIAGWSWNPTLIDYDAWYLTSGHGEAELTGVGTVDLRPGTLLISRPGDSATVTQNEFQPVRVLYTHFSFIDPRSGGAVHLPAELAPRQVLRTAQHSRIPEALRRLVRGSEPGHPMPRLRDQGILLDLLSAVYREQLLQDQGKRSDISSAVADDSRHFGRSGTFATLDQRFGPCRRYDTSQVVSSVRGRNGRDYSGIRCCGENAARTSTHRGNRPSNSPDCAAARLPRPCTSFEAVSLEIWCITLAISTSFVTCIAALWAIDSACAPAVAWRS